eukprot:12895501-Prorocentrum_lima.AAC.1
MPLRTSDVDDGHSVHQPHILDHDPCFNPILDTVYSDLYTRVIARRQLLRCPRSLPVQWLVLVP